MKYKKPKGAKKIKKSSPKKYNCIQIYGQAVKKSITSNKLNKISKNVNKNKYYKKSKRKRKKRKLKVNILYIIITFYRIFFRILFLFEETSKIKSVYGKQDYQPSAKIKTEKNQNS